MTRWLWGVWLLCILATFGLMEGLALHGGTVTLSQTVWDASSAFPLLPFLAGLLCGGLATHFWWREGG